MTIFSFRSIDSFDEKRIESEQSTFAILNCLFSFLDFTSKFTKSLFNS